MYSEIFSFLISSQLVLALQNFAKQLKLPEQFSLCFGELLESGQELASPFILPDLKALGSNLHPCSDRCSPYLPYE